MKSVCNVHCSPDVAFRFCDRTSEVPTGAVQTARSGCLRASAIGSCIVVALADPGAAIGGVAHVMLPGRAVSGKKSEPCRYAENGIRELVSRMIGLGARQDSLVACIAGGRNVLNHPSDNLCWENITSVNRTLVLLGVPLKVQNVGGNQRRSLTFLVDTGSVFMTLGDGVPFKLWYFDPWKHQVGELRHE